MDPFKIEGPTCLSFSTGRSSAYMLWRVKQSNDLATMARYLMVVFGNTGKEEEASLKFWRDCMHHWSIPIIGLEYVAGPTYKVVEFGDANRTGKPFEAVIKQRSGLLPNRVSRFCSSELKTRTIHRYLRDLGWKEWDSFVGNPSENQPGDLDLFWTHYEAWVRHGKKFNVVGKKAWAVYETDIQAKRRINRTKEAAHG